MDDGTIDDNFGDVAIYNTDTTPGDIHGDAVIRECPIRLVKSMPFRRTITTQDDSGNEAGFKVTRQAGMADNRQTSVLRLIQFRAKESVKKLTVVIVWLVPIGLSWGPTSFSAPTSECPLR